jgi:hypothetical protein
MPARRNPRRGALPSLFPFSFLFRSFFFFLSSGLGFMEKRINLLISAFKKKGEARNKPTGRYYDSGRVLRLTQSSTSQWTNDRKKTNTRGGARLQVTRSHHAVQTNTQTNK